MKNILLAVAVIAAATVFTGCHHHHHHKVIQPVQNRYIEAGPKHGPQKIQKLPPAPRPAPRPVPPPIR